MFRTISDRLSRSGNAGTSGGDANAVEAVHNARIIDRIRTAHLERLTDLTRAQVLYHRTRYDFDDSLIPEDLPPKRLGRLELLGHLLTTPYGVIEVNEPNMVSRWLELAAQVAAIRVRGLFTGRRAGIVAYCIGLTDPVAYLHNHKHIPPVLGRLLSHVTERLIIARMDRLAFGTSGSLDLYRSTVGGSRIDAKARVFEALPCPCRCLADSDVERVPETVLFIGAFDERKGVRQMLRLWEELERIRPQTRFHLIGKGRLQAEVEAWAAGRSNVTVDIDPPRAAIHRALRESTALMLLSQRIGEWREQIGLPILEALSHGCEVITTPETGLAAWLQTHGHVVLDSTGAGAARTVAERLTSARRAEQVLADLPTTDMRIEADRWLMAGES